MRALGLVAVLATPVSAQELPFAGYFTGTYELVSRMPDAQIGPVLDRVVIGATGEDFPLTLKACHIGEGELHPATSGHEGFWPLEGHLGALDLTCNVMNNGDNYPILNCYVMQDGENGMLTLWPSFLPTPPEPLKECP
jgi:hypothetical protein